MNDKDTFKYLESIEDNALIVVSNHDNDGDADDMGLIAGHAYSVEDFEGNYLGCPRVVSARTRALSLNL